MNITLIEQPEKKKMDIGCRREFMLKGSYQSLEGVICRTGADAKTRRIRHDL